MTLRDALSKAESAGLDLIEISPNANPPVAKITDYGKFQYAEKKKSRSAGKKSHGAEVKTIQIKIGTGEHDLALKAKKISEWLALGHRVRLELFLIGRSKYMGMDFLTERLERVLKFVSVEYQLTEAPQKGLKGLSVLIERKK